MDKIIVIGGSAGSFKVVSKILAALPENYKHPIIICLHRLRNVRSGFADTLAIKSKFTIKEARDKERIISSTAYIAPSNYHLMTEYGYTLSLSVEPPVNHSRPSIDITMETTAEVYREKTVGIILSGANNDGANGMSKIHKNGGITLVQDPDSCEIKTMPLSCLSLFKPTHIANVDTIIDFILELDK